MREVVRDAWKEIGRGIGPEESLRRWENGGPKVRHFDTEKDGWTWEHARDNHLAALGKRVETDDLAQATYDRYLIALHRRELALPANKLLKQVSPEDAMAIRDAALGRDVPFQAKVLPHAALHHAGLRSDKSVSRETGCSSAGADRPNKAHFEV